MDVCLTQAMAALATVLYSVYAAPPTASPVAGTPVTVNFNQFQLGSNDIPLSDQLLAPIGGQDTPEQVHIGIGSGMLPLQRMHWALYGQPLYYRNPGHPLCLMHCRIACCSLQSICQADLL